MSKVREMTWKEYCEKFKTASLYFHDPDKDFFAEIAEGDGCNLDREDIAAGYVDYWYAEVYSKAQGNCGGGLMLLEKCIQEENKTISEIISFIADNAELFDGMEDIDFTGAFVEDVEKGEELAEEYAA